MKTKLIVTLWLIMPICLLAQRNDSIAAKSSLMIFDLPAAIRYAMLHNYDFQKKQVEQLITYQQTKEVESIGLPKLSGSVTYQNSLELPTQIIPGDFVGQPNTFIPVQFGVQHFMDASLNLQQLIFDGRYLVGLKAIKHLKDLSHHQVQMSEQELKEQVSKLFYSAVIADLSLAKLDTTIQEVQKLKNQTEKIYEQGLIEELDIDRLTLNLSNLKNQQQIAQKQRDIAYFALNYNLGRDINLPILLKLNVDEELHQVKSKLLQSDTFEIEDRFEYKLLQDNYALKKLDLQKVKSSYLPALYGSFNIGYQSPRPNFDYFSGGQWYRYTNFALRLNVPIFNGLTTKRQEQQAKLNVDLAEISLNQAKNGFLLENAQRQINVKAALIEFENQKNLSYLSNKIYQKSKIKYQEGVGSSIELITAQSDKIRQDINALQSSLKLLLQFIEYQKSNSSL
ncbi:MAG: TolC family protein [Chitinophagales bacterium]|jgi:outer membrane protein TolC|nr:TolC family protein [Chitinophagales bacterium]